MSKSKHGCLDEATHYLVRLLKLTASAKDDDDKYNDFPVFSERVLYEALGKDVARSILALMRKLTLACGIENMYDPDPDGTKEANDEKVEFWALDRAIGEAGDSMHRLRRMFNDLDRAHDFSEHLTSTRLEIEGLFRDANYHSPEYVVSRLRQLLSITDYGNVRTKWEREEEAKKAKKKKAKKKAKRKAK